jgi:hypothetical protein
MTAKPPDTDVAKLAAQLAAVASAPGDAMPQVRAKLAPLAASIGVLGRALQAPEGDAAARGRVADELERARGTMTDALRASGPASAVPELRTLTATIDLVIGWLRAPTAESTAAIERLVAAIRAVPGGDALWTDQTAEAKRKAELDADVQKSLDEIKASMPKLKL